MDEEPAENAKSAAERVSRLNCTAINHVHKRAVKFQVSKRKEVCVRCVR